MLCRWRETTRWRKLQPTLTWRHQNWRSWTACLRVWFLKTRWNHLSFAPSSYLCLCLFHFSLLKWIGNFLNCEKEKPFSVTLIVCWWMQFCGFTSILVICICIVVCCSGTETIQFMRYWYRKVKYGRTGRMITRVWNFVNIIIIAVIFVVQYLTEKGEFTMH